MKIICKFKFQPEVDLFASRLNAQLPSFQQRALRSSSRVGIPRQPNDMTTTLGNERSIDAISTSLDQPTAFPTKIFESGESLNLVLISRHSKISPIMCPHYGQWDIL